MKTFRQKLFTILVALSCVPCLQAQTQQAAERGDPAIIEKSKYMAAIARRDLSLNDEETHFLENAFYDRYFAGQERTREVADPALVAEIKNAIHKEFSKRIYKYYGREKSAEIIAWYYNYTNKTRQQ